VLNPHLPDNKNSEGVLDVVGFASPFGEAGAAGGVKTKLKPFGPEKVVAELDS